MPMNSLVQDLAQTNVNNVKNRGAGEDGSGGDRDDSQHGEAAVDQLSLRGQACSTSVGFRLCVPLSTS